jgi:hypothetical protein
MVRPTEEERDLQNLNSLPPQRLRPQFVAALDTLRSKIIAKAQTKMLKGVPLTARMFLTMLQSFVGRINSAHGVPSIASAWEDVV